MTVYIIKEKDELQLIAVPARKKSAFQKKYADKIIVSGKNVRQALAKYHAIPMIFIAY